MVAPDSGPWPIRRLTGSRSSVSEQIIQPRTLRGFTDILPAAGQHRRRMIMAIEDVFTSFGFDPIQTPAVEYAEILKGKGGAESDKQMFEFEDQGGRAVALRFDLTVPLARFVAQHHARLTLPLRAFNIGYVWRGERPQRGRYREFLQCDADIIGDTGVTADAEILSIIQTALLRMEIGPLVLRLNNRRILNGLLENLRLGDRIVAVLRALDKIDKIGPGGVVAELGGVGVSSAAVDRILAVVGCRQQTNEQTLARMAELVGASAEGEAGLAEVRQVLDLVAAATGRSDLVRFDPSIVRGLDYYTGVVFEVMHEWAPEVGSIGGGGRYDNLSGLYTARKLPGVGGTIGVSRILSALEGLDRLPKSGRQRTLVVVTRGPECDSVALAGIAAAVRATGTFDVDLFPARDAKHGAQMKYADSRGARYVLTLDPEGTVSVKDLVSGMRTASSVTGAADLLAKWEAER